MIATTHFHYIVFFVVLTSQLHSRFSPDSRTTCNHLHLAMPQRHRSPHLRIGRDRSFEVSKVNSLRSWLRFPLRTIGLRQENYLYIRATL